MRKFNYLQILVHLIATFFFIFSFRTFSGIYNIRIWELVEKNGVESLTKNSEKYGITALDIYHFTVSSDFFISIGIFVAFIISILISIKKKWSVWNSFIVIPYIKASVYTPAQMLSKMSVNITVDRIPSFISFNSNGVLSHNMFKTEKCNT